MQYFTLRANGDLGICIRIDTMIRTIDPTNRTDNANTCSIQYSSTAPNDQRMQLIVLYLACVGRTIYTRARFVRLALAVYYSAK